VFKFKSSDYQLGYRGDIEGLRAIAILLVVAAHANIPWLAGGFVGVDVFFVLSGYLITGLLIQEINKTGDLGFAAFYARRIRRLMPALLLMLICVSLFSWLLASPFIQYYQAISASSASFWGSNFYFAFSNLGYFGPDARSNLFLHTWSLGVEEQFYIVWPLLVVLFAGAWRGARKAPQVRRLKVIMPVIFVISFLLCLWWTYRQPDLAFYMMPSRAWQFALGALVFLYFSAPDISQSGVSKPLFRNKIITKLGGWFGLALIMIAACLLNDDMPYPGTWALLPSFGAAAIIAAGAKSQRTGIGRVLSVGPMQSIGRVSYSWYLWHWPVLLLGTSVFSMNSALQRFGLVVISFVIAGLSYRFLEAPIRHLKWLVIKPRITVIAGFLVMAFASVIAMQWYSASMRRVQEPIYAQIVKATWDAPVIYNIAGCDDWYFDSKVNICAFGSKDADHTAVILGDSVGMQWFPAIKEIYDRPGWRILALTKSSCPMVDVPLFYVRINRIYTECSVWRSAVLQQLKQIKPDVVILGSTYTYDYTKKQWISGTFSVLNEISASTKHIYLLRSTPTLSFDGPACLVPRSWLYSKLIGNNLCIAPAHNKIFDNVYSWLESAARHFKNVKTIDMTDVICPHDQCDAERDGVIVFRDSQHMTATFTRSLAPDLAKYLQFKSGNST